MVLPLVVLGTVLLMRVLYNLLDYFTTTSASAASVANSATAFFPLELVPPCDIDLGFADDNGAFSGHLLGVLGLLVLLLLPCESHRVAIFSKSNFFLTWICQQYFLDDLVHCTGTGVRFLNTILYLGSLCVAILMHFIPKSA